MQREEGSAGVDGSRDEIDGAKMIVDSVVTYTMLGMREICPEGCDHELETLKTFIRIQQSTTPFYAECRRAMQTFPS